MSNGMGCGARRICCTDFDRVRIHRCQLVHETKAKSLHPLITLTHIHEVDIKPSLKQCCELNVRRCSVPDMSHMLAECCNV